MKHLKWSGIIATTVFLALAQQACGVAVDDEQDETSTESAVTGEAQEALDSFSPECTYNSECPKDEQCMSGTCVRLMHYPED